MLRAALPGADVQWRAPGVDEVTAALLAALRFDACDDARPALLAARVAGRRVVVVSNWDVSLGEVLELAGLAPLLDAVVTSAAVGAPKPAPAIFRHALALAGVVAQRAVHVGDNLAQDVEGARACGIQAVLLARDDRPAHVPPGVRVITSLTQLFDAA
ncbi:MAG: HAD-IA family hydrolase [Solirubrobacteraceae bacterium]